MKQIVRKKPLAVAITLALSLSNSLYAATITVNDMSDTGTGCTLRKAIVNANQRITAFPECTAGAGDDTIVIPAGTYTLTKELPLIIENTVLQGASLSTTIIDGASSYRIFFVGYTAKSPTVTLKNMTIQNAKAQGGAGSGGGAGLGAGLFMYSGNVTVDTVRFANNQAIGGTSGGNGGGGLGGSGAGNGGGGFDVSAAGGAYSNGTGGVVGGGGAGYGTTYTGGVGGYGSGGNGGINAGNGGFGGGGGTGATTSGIGGFGGGGGSINSAGKIAGFGGFGGGGALGWNGGAGPSTGGNGGFGGGGGGSAPGGTPGIGGYGGGAGGGAGGGSGGGAGFGGAVFAKTGTMTLKTVTFNTNSSTNGTGANNGLGKGGAIFICSYGTGTGQINHASANGQCSATVSASSCGITFTGNTASNPAATATDTVDYFGNFPTGASTACSPPPSLAPINASVDLLSHDELNTFATEIQLK